MSRTKKPSKPSADEREIVALYLALGIHSERDERAFLNRIRSLNEEDEKLTFEELIAYFNIMHKIDPSLVRHSFEEAFIERGLTNSDVLRLLEGAKERAKWKQ